MSAASPALIETAPALLALVKRLNTAFYADGTRKALQAVLCESKALIAKAEGRTT